MHPLPPHSPSPTHPPSPSPFPHPVLCFRQNVHPATILTILTVYTYVRTYVNSTYVYTELYLILRRIFGHFTYIQYVYVKNLRSSDLRLTPTLQSHSRLCVSKYRCQCGIGQQKDVSHALAITRDTRNGDREKNSGEATSVIFER